MRVVEAQPAGAPCELPDLVPATPLPTEAGSASSVDIRLPPDPLPITTQGVRRVGMGVQVQVDDSTSTSVSTGAGMPGADRPPGAGKERFCDAATARAVGLRIFARILAVVFIIVILRIFPAELAAAGRAYLAWIHGFGHVQGPFIFFAAATTFCSVSPTGYFMNVAAGVTYGDEEEFGPSGYAIAFVLSYLCTLCGSAVNLMLVRGCMGRWRWLRRRFGQPDLVRPDEQGGEQAEESRKDVPAPSMPPAQLDARTFVPDGATAAQAIGAQKHEASVEEERAAYGDTRPASSPTTTAQHTAAVVVPSVPPPVSLDVQAPPPRKAGALRYIAGLETALRVQPMRIVILLRLPFLGNGALNYWLSFNTLGARPIPILPMMLGNAIGMLPGSILFALLGRQIRSLASLIAWGTRDPSTIGVFVGIVLALLTSIASVLWVARRFAQAERKALQEAEQREKEGRLAQVQLQVEGPPAAPAAARATGVAQ